MGGTGARTRRSGRRNKTGRFAVVVSRFHEFITRRLLEGCLEELDELGVPASEVSVVWVPGAYDMPVVVAKLARRRSVRAVICLGAVIRGETRHFELVADNAARGLMDVALATGKPVALGVLACETVGQARDRAGDDEGNKGREAARAAFETLEALRRIGS